MALVVKDRVKVRSTTTGTGTLTLGTAFAGFQTFNNALGDGDTTYYGIFESSTGEFEVGIGTFTSSGNTLSRDTVLESSNTGAKVNLTADTEVFITYPAEKSVYFDANGDVNLNRDPQSALQAATKQYVDTIAAAGLHYHAPVRVEHPSNLTATYDNGTSGVGATLTNSGTQAVLVLDNVTMVVSDRVLIANQTNQAHNGVYTVTNIGSASTNWVLTRATDADSYGPSDPDALGEGDAFFIKEGDTNAGHLDVMTTSGTITFGTTNIVFSEVAETTVYSAGNGLSLSGTEFNVGPGTGITVNATTVSTVQDIATSATPTFDGLNTTGDITFGDNDKAIFGAGSDLQIYHDASASYIDDQGEGPLKIKATDFRIKNAADTKNYLRADDGGAVSIYYDNALKLATTSTGIDVTGTVTADGLTVDTSTLHVDATNNRVGVGTTAPSQKVEISDTSTADVALRMTNNDGNLEIQKYQDDLAIKLNDTGDIIIRSGSPSLLQHMRIANNGDISFYEDTGTTAKFFWDASAESLGIGTSSPSAPLTVQTSATTNVEIKTSAINGTAQLRFSNDARVYSLGIDNNDSFFVYDATGTSTRMIIDSSGRVGIGTSSPDEALVVVGDLKVDTGANAGVIHFGDVSDQTKIVGFDSTGTIANTLLFTTGTIERMRISSGGVLSVGNTSPKTWHSNSTGVIQFGGMGALENYNSTDDVVILSANQYRASDGVFKYMETNEATRIVQYQGNIYFSTAPSGTADTAATFTDRLYITNAGLVGIGTSSPTTSLNIEAAGVSSAGENAHVRINDTTNMAAGVGGVIQLSGEAATGSNSQYVFGTIKGIKENGTSGNYDGALTFSTRTNGVSPAAERMRIGSSGNVGINNTAPSALLEVGNADDFTLGGTSGDSLESLRLTYDTVNADRLVFSTERTSTGTTWAEAAHRIQRLVDVTNMGYMQFGHHNSDLITFGENTTEYARIDGDGNLLVGKTSTNTINTVGHDITDHGEVMHTTNGGTTMYLNRKTSDGTIIDLRKDGTTVGSIGTSGGDLNIGTGDTGLGFADSLDSILPMTITGNTVRDNAIDIGYSIYRFKDLYLSGSLSDGTTSRTVADIVGLTSSQFLRSDADDSASGDITFSGILTTSGSSSGGVRIGSNSSGYPLLTTVSGVEFVIRDTDQIRFSDSTSWDYSAWAGIRYESGSNLMTIGGPSSSKFTSNAGPPDITINFDGLSGDDGLTYEGNPIWHDGNTWSVIDYVGDISTQNWNDYIDGSEASWARVLNMSGSNRPPNYTYGTALSISVASANKFQLYASHTGSSGNGLYFRTGWNTDYKGWAKIYDSVAHPALGYVDVATGNYGTIKVDDDRGVTWAGYAIRDDWVFMSSGDGAAGIYNDTDNEWAIYCVRNAQTSLYYNGTATFATTSGGAAVTGALTATGDITAYFSDERLKDFDGKIEGALDKVSQLNGYYYHENDKAKELGFDNDARQVGVSAQEVEAVLPEVIKPAPVDPEYKTVQYEKLVPLLIEAIKELKEEVRQLKEDKA